MKPTHIIFDFDGVLVDSMKNNLRAWREALAPYNVTIKDSAYYQIEGLTPQKVVNTFLAASDGEVKNIVAKKEEIYAEGPRSNLYEGMREFLFALKERGLPLAVASGGGRTRIENALNDHEILDCFDVIITADNVKNGKPHPEPYLRALEGLNCNPEQALVIENAPLGVDAAKAADLYTIAVGSTLSQKYLTKADHFCSDHKTLYQYINHLLEVTR